MTTRGDAAARGQAEPLDVDVVIVTYDSAGHVGAALAALPPCASVRVVDNASSDGSAAVAAAAGAEVDRSDVNIGFAAGANRGARAGRAPAVLFLNPDAVIDGPSLHRLVDALDRDPALGIVGPSLQRPDGTEQAASWPFPSPSSSWRQALGLGGGRPSVDPPVFVIGAALLVRRSVFESLHGFDERFWLYAEETDLCRRAMDAGWAVSLVPGAVAVHAGGASGAGVADLVAEHFDRGLEHFILKHHGTAALVSTRLALAAGSVVRAVAPGPADRRRFHRRRLRRLGRLAASAPAAVALDSPATTAPGAGVVVCSLERWDDVWRRNQFFVRELLELDPNRRVLFVEPPFDHVHELRQRRGRTRRRGLRPLPDDGRVVRIEPGKVWPRLLGPLADRSLRRQVRRAADRLGFVDPVLWVNDPAYAGLAGATGWPAVYDITDDWTEAGTPGRASRRIAAAEARLAEECGRVVVCSDGLAATRRAARPDLVVIPNAVDVEHVRRPRPRPDDLPATPVAVYVGTLHTDRLDVDLVEALAGAEPDLHVVLVGPDALPPAVSARLEALANVSLLGPRPYEHVPAYLQHADVVVIPHVVSPFTESLDPIKAYECLAVGRPTVATPVAGFRDLGPPVEVAAGAAFVDAVGRAVRTGRPTAVADVPSWSDRARRFAAELAGARRSRDEQAIRVDVIDHCARLSGAELSLARLVPALDGVAVHVVLGERGPIEERLRAAGASVEVRPLDPAVAATSRQEVGRRLGVARAASAARSTVELARVLRRRRPDLVHTNSLKANLYGGIAARLAGRPVVWHLHDRVTDDDLPTPVVRAIRALARVLPRAVIANSRSTLATLGPGLDAAVLPSPLDPAFLDVPPPRADGDDHPFTAVMVGRLAPWKGQDVFLRAFATAFPDGDERAVVAGSALFGEEGYGRALADLVVELGLEGRVALPGFVEDVAGVLAGADCLVHASVLPEPFGQVVVEGMAAGRAVIAAAAGGPAEVVTDGVDGLLHPPGDVAALARQLRRVAADPDLRRELGERARQRAADFRPEVVGAATVEVYRRVLGRADLGPADDPIS